MTPVAPPAAHALAAVRRPLRVDRLPERTPAGPETPTDDVLLVGLDEAARRLSLAPRSVRRLAAEGRLTYARVGRALRFRPADLARFADAAVVSSPH